MLYADLLLLNAPHRWQFATLGLIATRGDSHARVFPSRRAAWRAIDTYRRGRCYMRPLKVD